MTLGNIKTAAKNALEYHLMQSQQNGTTFNPDEVIEDLRLKIESTGLFDQSEYLPILQQAFDEFNLKNKQ